MADPTRSSNAEPLVSKAEEGNPKKSKQGVRKRVSQACDKCRSRKDKCDGKKPSCSTCVTNGRTCSYDANVKKRGLPEGYVRGLEKLWGLAIREVDEVEDTLLTALVGGEEVKESSLCNWNDEANSEALVEIWRKSQISRELERLLSSQEPSTDGKRRRVDSDAQPPKKFDNPASLQPKNGQDLGYVPEACWPDVESGNAQGNEEAISEIAVTGSYHDHPALPEKVAKSILSPKAPLVSSSGTLSTNVRIQDLPSETWHLLDVYFSYTHSWLPIIEKHDLLRISYQYSQSRNTSSHSSSSGDHAVLWAAIAYAKFQHRAINNIPRALGPVGDIVWTAERMYAQARSLIPNEEGHFELGHVQALLILTLANIGIGQLRRAWLLIGQAVRLAVDLKLDQPIDQGANGSKTKIRSKHVFLGCFALDTLLAARLNHRPQLRSEDVSNIGPIEEDGLEEWDPWTDCLNVRRVSDGSRVPASILSTFNRLIGVLKILNEAASLSPRSNTVQASTVLLEKLHIWSQSQPLPLYFDSSAVDQARTLLPHQYHLHNVYFTTLAMSQLLSHCDGKEPVNLEPCTRSARHIADLLSQHSNTFGLLIVPPTYELFVKTAYDVVHAVRSSIESTHIAMNDWKRSLDHCVENMEPAWTVFEAFKISADYQSVFDSHQENQVLDFMSSTNQEYDSPSGKTPQSMTSHETLSTYSPQVFRPPIRETSQQGRGLHSAKVVVRPASQRISSFGQTSTHGLPMDPLNIYENAHAVYSQPNRDQTGPKLTQRTSQPRLTQSSHPSLILEQPSEPQHHRSMTMSSADVEFDPMFNELMRLDATEWSGNWDQSLMNLGFTDSDNMNRDFYSFCQEPDPLHQNSVFQQLVAISNVETTDLFDGSGTVIGGGLGGLGMGMGMGFGIADGDDGIEASQILQSLSASEEQRALGIGNR